MSYESLCKTAEYFKARARRTRHIDKQERFAAVAKKYRLRAEIQRKLEGLQAASTFGKEQLSPANPRGFFRGLCKDAPGLLALAGVFGTGRTSQ
jgi:hypothetical protein